jgi:hypothetical protein
MSLGGYLGWPDGLVACSARRVWGTNYSYVLPQKTRSGGGAAGLTPPRTRCASCRLSGEQRVCGITESLEFVKGPGRPDGRSGALSRGKPGMPWRACCVIAAVVRVLSFTILSCLCHAVPLQAMLMRLCRPCADHANSSYHRLSACRCTPSQFTPLHSPFPTSTHLTNPPSQPSSRSTPSPARLPPSTFQTH